MSAAPSSRGDGTGARAARKARDARLAQLDFDRAPFTIAWEVTRACAYSCLHCRADAQPRRHPLELTTAEGRALIEELATFGTRPILVLTGGDPLMRRDIFVLARHADRHGLRVSLTPTATALATRARMRAAGEAGIRRVAFSLDAAEPGAHDHFRGFEGSFARTITGIENARAEGLSLQVNTTVCRLNRGELERMVPLLERLGVVQWSVFFLVPTGRGTGLPMLSAGEHEQVLGWLHELSRDAPFDVKSTAAPQYRRIAAQRSRDDRNTHGAAAGPERHRTAGGPLAGAGYRFA
ncbi:MAG: radical SAM protein, partial [bacterium]